MQPAAFILSSLYAFIDRQDGQDVAEYALLMVLITVGIIAAVVLMGERLVHFYELTVRLLDRSISIAA